ncbi:translation initiation factor IF-2-like [Harpia harpyja]|uniref:translation initiation factor IF-2-like n=1 Tax=Harpia harpyja TaxID=202280 RepID=UPI0022B13758|nr:translation initiation factor IF-2-like [Harpia harpyja]
MPPCPVLPPMSLIPSCAPRPSPPPCPRTDDSAGSGGVLPPAPAHGSGAGPPGPRAAALHQRRQPRPLGGRGRGRLPAGSVRDGRERRRPVADRPLRAAGSPPEPRRCRSALRPRPRPGLREGVSRRLGASRAGTRGGRCCRGRFCLRARARARGGARWVSRGAAADGGGGGRSRWRSGASRPWKPRSPSRRRGCRRPSGQGSRPPQPPPPPALGRPRAPPPRRARAVRPAGAAGLNGVPPAKAAGVNPSWCSVILYFAACNFKSGE